MHFNATSNLRRKTAYMGISASPATTCRSQYLQRGMPLASSESVLVCRCSHKYPWSCHSQPPWLGMHENSALNPRCNANVSRWSVQLHAVGAHHKKWTTLSLWKFSVDDRSYGAWLSSWGTTHKRVSGSWIWCSCVVVIQHQRSAVQCYDARNLRCGAS